MADDIEESTTTAMAGCLRGAIGFSASVMIAVTSGIGIGINYGTGTGILAGLVILLALVAVSVHLMNNAKNITVLDCILPIPIGAVSAFLFAPISLAEASVFSALTCMGASLLLTIMLFLYKSKRIYVGWLVIPFIVFIYELLPIELPTDLDNLLCMGGDGINFVIANVFRPDNNKLLK